MIVSPHSEGLAAIWAVLVFVYGLSGIFELFNRLGFKRVGIADPEWVYFAELGMCGLLSIIVVMPALWLSGFLG